MQNQVQRNITPCLTYLLPVVALLLLLPSVSWAMGIPWTSPVTLSRGVRIQDAKVVIDSAGVSTAAWETCDDSSGGSGCRVYVARKEQGVWQPATKISTTSSYAYVEDLVVDATGNVTLGFQDGTPKTIRWSSGQWQSPVALSNEWAYGVRLLVDSSSRVTAIWRQWTGSAYTLNLRRFTGGVWGATETVADVGNSLGDLSAHMSPSGKMVLAWWEYSQGLGDRIRALVFNGTVWSPVANLTAFSGDAESFSWPEVVINDAGNATVGWIRQGSSNQFLLSRSYTAGTGVWANAEVINQDQFNSMQLGITQQGTPIVAMTRWNGNAHELFIRRRDSSWGAEEVVHASNEWMEIHGVLAYNTNSLALVWNQNQKVIVKRSEAGGSFGAPLELNLSENQYSWNMRPAINPAGTIAQLVYNNAWFSGDQWLTGARLNAGQWEVTGNLTQPSGYQDSKPQVVKEPIRIGTAQPAASATVWQRFDGNTSLIQMNVRCQNRTLSGMTQEAYTPQLATDGAGNHIAVWSALNENVWIIQSRRYLNPDPNGCGQWGETETIGVAGTTSNAPLPKVVMDPLGQVTVLWRHNNFLQARRYSAGAWGAITDISASNEWAQDPQLAVDPTGGVTAVWQGQDRIRGRRWSGSWGGIFDVNVYNGQYAQEPRLAVDGNGAVTIIWSEDNVIQSRRLVAGSWGSVMPLSLLSGQNLALDADDAGNVIALWRGWSNGYRILGRRFSNGWGELSTLSEEGGDAGSPAVALGGSGFAAAIWAQWDGQHYVIRGRHYHNGDWDAVKNISPTGFDAAEPELAANALGDITAVWRLQTGTGSVIQRADYWPAPEAPTNVTAEAGNQKALVSWAPPASNGGAPVNSYLVNTYMGSEQTGQTCRATAPETTCWVTGLTNGNTYTFRVRAMNMDGDFTEGSVESVPSNSVTPSVAFGARLIGISTRANVGTGDNVMIGGFVIGGSEPKKVLIRAIGPSMASAGVSGTLANPTLTLTTVTGQPIASNDDWQTNNPDSEEIQALGRAPNAPNESALLITLEPNTPYTPIVSGVGGTRGVALVEVYEITENNLNTRLIGISTRANVGTGDNVMIGGFVIGGSEPKKVLIRAIGPSMASAGVSGTLANPTLTLTTVTGQPIASNDDWQTNNPGAAEIQALGRAPSNIRESALLVTLEPNTPYTPIVSGLGNTSGVALVEVYEVE